MCIKFDVSSSFVAGKKKKKSSFSPRISRYSLLLLFECTKTLVYKLTIMIIIYFFATFIFQFDVCFQEFKNFKTHYKSKETHL